MKKIQLHQFDPEIYPFKLWISVTEDINKVVSENFVDGDSQGEITYTNTDGFKAITQKVRQKNGDCFVGAVIVFRKKKYMTVGTMAHEASHAAKFLFDHIGADVTAHEPFEYLLGWMADCINKVRLNK